MASDHSERSPHRIFPARHSIDARTNSPAAKDTRKNHAQERKTREQFLKNRHAEPDVTTQYSVDEIVRTHEDEQLYFGSENADEEQFIEAALVAYGIKPAEAHLVFKHYGMRSVPVFNAVLNGTYTLAGLRFRNLTAFMDYLGHLEETDDGDSSDLIEYETHRPTLHTDVTKHLKLNINGLGNPYRTTTLSLDDIGDVGPDGQCLFHVEDRHNDPYQSQQVIEDLNVQNTELRN